MIDYTKLLSDRDQLNPDLSFYKDKVVMIVGAGGSIGSELSRQVLIHNPEKVILFGRNENNLFFLERDLNDNRAVVKVGSITNFEPLHEILKTYKPDVVLHAAANKHVPLCESNIYEAFYNNLYGTEKIFNECVHAGVKHFVFISTDKACNPKSVMGITKRLCEIWLLTEAKFIKSDINCSVVRFGNVLGSSGSVIPIFQKQINDRNPITITHKNMTRYFMSIPEAATLVLSAALLTNESDKNVGKYVLDMGEQIKISDLAENLIKLNNLIPHKDIQIIETGIRPGEKIAEELSEDYNNVTNTRINKILNLIPDYNLNKLSKIISLLRTIDYLTATDDSLLFEAKNILDIP